MTVSQVASTFLTCHTQAGQDGDKVARQPTLQTAMVNISATQTNSFHRLIIKVPRCMYDPIFPFPVDVARYRYNSTGSSVRAALSNRAP